MRALVLAMPLVVGCASLDGLAGGEPSPSRIFDAAPDAEDDVADATPDRVDVETGARIHPSPDASTFDAEPDAEADAAPPLRRARVTFTYGSMGMLCGDVTQRSSIYCAAAAHRLCIASGFATGFPVDRGIDATKMSVLCLGAPSFESDVPYDALTAHVSDCTASSAYSLACTAASDQRCASLAQDQTGFGPLENDTLKGEFTIACLPAGVVDRVTVTPTLFDDCQSRRGAACDADADAYCAMTGHFGGYGPIELTGPSTLIVFCVK